MKTKKLITVVAIIVAFYGCSNDDDNFTSALNGLIGEWNLQSKSINNQTVSAIEDDKLFFIEDTNTSDFNGDYIYLSASETNGSFMIDLYNTIVFTSNEGDSITYDFELNAITLGFEYEDANGDLISEVWIRKSNFVE